MIFENLRRSNTGQSRSRTPITEDKDPFLREGRKSEEFTQACRSSTDRAVSPPTLSSTKLQSRLTDALLAATPDQYKAATENRFLQLAGEGRLSKKTLSRWLSQDRLYAEAYINFITALIARVTLPFAFVSDKSVSLRWRIINLLNGAFQNILTEIEFFTKTAEEYGLDLDLPFDDSTGDFEPNQVTEQYLTLFRSFHLEPTQSLLEGLIVLWATEKCYQQAWSYASTFTESLAHQPKEDSDGGALRERFIPNWSSDEFGKFVQDLADITDELAQREGAGKKIEVYKALWSHVLEIEKGFWPDVGSQ